jgi:hypothetical protein
MTFKTMTFKTRNLFLARLLGLSLMIGALEASAAVPQVLNHQGRVSVGGENFDGDGQFKFALVNGDGTTSYWSNDGTSNGEHGEPSEVAQSGCKKPQDCYLQKQF